jgi:acyl-coenzyme A synthetase/AMP-(fatty) acid ligase
MKSVPAAEFYNLYGQTEANTSLYYWIEQMPSDGTRVIPIGKALPNFKVFALDENGRKINKPGENGELYVRGASVALGYLGEPEKTGASFVKNPLNPNVSETIYRTGDLVTLDGDGNYIFVGRKDHMIKSRGYRIELGEIETAIVNHEQVKNSVVIAIPDELIGNRIAAVIVPLSKGTIRKEDIIRYCATRLPRYMIPEIIEFRDSLPMTSSGKVDRKNLGGVLSKIVARARKQE